MKKLNLVVFVIRSTRLDQKFQENVERMMQWLDYPSHTSRFLFVISHCEHNSEDDNERLQNQLKKCFNLKKIPLLERIDGRVIKECLPIKFCGFSRSENMNGDGKNKIREFVESLHIQMSINRESFDIYKNSSGSSCLIL